MTTGFHLMPAEHVLSLAKQHQADLALQFAAENREQSSRIRFVRLFHLRRVLFRLVPRFAAHI